MKKMILLASILTISTTTLNAEFLMKIPRKTCTENGGGLEKGKCKADWKNAVKICESMGAKLPTVKELEKVITECGGKVGDIDNNDEDPDYKSCIKNKGFIGSRGYWTLTKYETYDNASMRMKPFRGYFDSRYDHFSQLIPCVK